MLLQFFKHNWMPLTLGGLALLAVAIIIFVPRHQAMTARRSMSEVIQKLPDEKRGEEWLKAEKEIAAIGNSARTTLAQILGGIVLLIGLYFTYQNAKTAQATLRVTEDGKITDRFSKAVELLGSEKEPVRLGGIYALERIARDSKHDHWTIMEVLTAYIRLRSPRIEGEAEEPQFDKEVTTDIQAALDVIGRRKWVDSEGCNQKIGLSSINLTRASLRNAFLNQSHFVKTSLVRADLSGTSLQSAILIETDLTKGGIFCADLSSAILTEAILTGAIISQANLSRALLAGADLSRTAITTTNLSHSFLVRANLSNADFSDTDFTGANLYDANLKGADLTGAKSLTWEQIKSAIIDDDTKLPPELEAMRQAEQQNKTSES